MFEIDDERRDGEEMVFVATADAFQKEARLRLEKKEDSADTMDVSQ